MIVAFPDHAHFLAYVEAVQMPKKYTFLANSSLKIGWVRSGHATDYG